MELSCVFEAPHILYLGNEVELAAFNLFTYCLNKKKQIQSSTYCRRFRFRGSYNLHFFVSYNLLGLMFRCSEGRRKK